MAGTFDPYHKWLGISAKDQPPNFYRLLNIELFESDPDVIEGAADRQMAHVRTFQTGQHSAQSQRLLNELSAARICLLDPEKRAAYDRTLRAQCASHTPASQVDKTSITIPLPPSPVVPVAPTKAIALSAIPVQAMPSPPDFRNETRALRSASSVFWKQPTTIAGLLMLLLLFLSGMAVALALHGNPTATNNVADSESNQTNLPEPILDRTPLPDLAEVSAQQGFNQEPPGDQSAVSPPMSSSSEDPIESINNSPAEQELAALVNLGAKIERNGNGSERSIVKIDLSRTAVVDTDLALLRVFPGLSGLRLDGTQITDAGLQQIETLLELRTLNLRGTHVTDEGLSSLEKFPKLSMLDLRNTRVTGEAILSFRRRLPRVSVFFDSSTAAAIVTPLPAVGSGLGPPAANEPDPSAIVRKLGGSTRRDLKLPEKPVVELRIDNDVVTDADLEFLQGLTTLISLELHGERLTDKTLSYLRSLTSLTLFTIDRARITDEGLECLAELKRLVSLRITHAPITDAGLKHLKELSELEFLDLAETQVAGSGLGQLRAVHLKTLALDRTNLSDKSISPVARFAQLHTLSMQDTRVSDQGLLKLRRLKVLEVVNVSGTKITKAGMDQFRKGRKSVSINSFHRTLPQMPARPAEVSRSNPVSQDGATVILGGTNDPVFEERASEGGYLIGFEIGTEPFGQSAIVATVRPIFRTPNGEVMGKQYGNRRKEVISVKSKEGYVVGAITLKAGLFIDGFSMTFVRLKDGKVIATDSYESQWLGGRGGGEETKLGGGNTPAVGIVGKSNDSQCTGLGLLFATKTSK